MANTTVPYSEAAVASMAASLLDEYNIVSLDEDTPLARFMSREFGFVRDEVLQIYPWHVAGKRVSLSPLANEPEFGWKYAYQLPSDCIRVRPLRDGGLLDTAELPHEIEGGQILTDQPAPLYVRYTYRLTNMSKWRPMMARLLACRLAMYAATRITGKSMYYEKCVQEYNRAFFEATHADSLERGSTERVQLYDNSHDAISVRGIT